MKIALITGDEPHYQLGLVSGLAGQNLDIDVIGGDSLQSAWSFRHERVQFKNLRGTIDPQSSIFRKLTEVLVYYFRLCVYTAKTDSVIFHIQWPYKFVYFDRTLLNVVYKTFGKRIVFTAHNVDREARDGRNSPLNRFTLWLHYHLVDHIIVHTDKMKADLVAGFRVKESKVSVIPHGINSTVPQTSIGREDARKMLCIKSDEHVILFFGLIDRYKGLDYLVEALALLKRDKFQVKLIIAGKVKECPEYWEFIQSTIDKEILVEQVILDLRHIPDDSVEVYFKAADVLVMPYRAIFQSGVLFLSYRFGLPVIAADVGSLKEDMIEGRTGFIAKAQNADDLAKKILSYFSSNLYKALEHTRKDIQAFASAKYSWSGIGAQTQKLYSQVLAQKARFFN
jgi:D-inositol-3-phosphate glycosyltransferase